MSDQVSGPLGGLFVVIGILFFIAGPAMSLLLGYYVSLAEWAASIVTVIIYVGTGSFMVTHEYWWWPTHAEDRVNRLQDHEREEGCKPR